MLQYVDDLVILDNTEVGLQKALDALNTYNQKKRLIINSKKTKILIFGKHPPGGWETKSLKHAQATNTLESGSTNEAQPENT